MALDKEDNSSFDLSPEERPVSKASLLGRLFLASFTLFGMLVSGVLKDLFLPSVAKAALAHERISISTQSLEKNLNYAINTRAPHHSSSLYNSLLENHLSERSTFKIVEQIPSIAPIKAKSQL